MLSSDTLICPIPNIVPQPLLEIERETKACGVLDRLKWPASYLCRNPLLSFFSMEAAEQSGESMTSAVSLTCFCITGLPLTDFGKAAYLAELQHFHF